MRMFPFGRGRGSATGSNCSVLKDYCKKLNRGDPSVKAIVLDGRRIGDAGAQKLATALQHCSSQIRSIDLSGNELTGRGVAVLLNAMISSPLIKAYLLSLDLGKNMLGSFGFEDHYAFEAIREFLAQNDVLSSLSLYANLVDATGVQILCSGLRPSERMSAGRGGGGLSVLNLGRNRIGTHGALALAEMLKTNTSLTWIRLSENNIEDMGVKSLWETLYEGYNATLQSLDLGQNPISEFHYIDLIEGLLEDNSNGKKRITPTRVSGDTVDETISYHTDPHPRFIANESASVHSNGSSLAHNIVVSVGPTIPRVSLDAGTAPQSTAVEATFTETTAPPSEASNNEKEEPNDKEDEVDAEVEKGRDVVWEAIKNPLEKAAEVIPVAYMQLCTSDFSKDTRLGRGAFGEVFEGYDSELDAKFVVKRLRVEILGEDKTEQEIQDARLTFERELSTLKKFKHPNVANLYGYNMSKDLRGMQYLVFALAKNGSLDRFLLSDSGRVRLSWDKRIQIAIDIAAAVAYLHKGAVGNVSCFHRDIKAANICMNENFSALLIDCGLAKIVPNNEDEPHATMTIRPSSGGSVLGTLGYMCPKYSAGFIAFEESCDVFSLGIVLIEIITGVLQNMKETGNGRTAKKINHFTLYCGRHSKRELHEDLDVNAGRADPEALKEMCKLALVCAKEDPEERPTSSEVVRRLQAVALLEAGSTGSAALVSNVGEDGKVLDRGTCEICLLDDVAGLSCKNTETPHFLCVPCAKRHIFRHIRDDEVGCASPGCRSSPFTDEDLERVSLDLSKRHQMERSRNAAVERMKEMKMRFALVSQPAKKSHLRGLAKMRRSQDLTRALQTVVNFAGGDNTQCPTLALVVPGAPAGEEGITIDSVKWFEDEGVQTVQLFFVCEHDFSVLNDPIIVNVNGSWLETVAPLLMVGLLVMQEALNEDHDQVLDLLDLPQKRVSRRTEGLNRLKLESWNACVGKLLYDKEAEMLEDVFTEFKSGGPKDPAKEKSRETVEKLVKEGYTLLVEKALDPFNRSWRDKMSLVLDDDGNLLWVKSESGGSYFSLGQL